MCVCMLCLYIRACDTRVYVSVSCLHVSVNVMPVCLCDVFAYICVCDAVFMAVLCCPFVCELSVCDSVPQHVIVVPAWIFVWHACLCIQSFSSSVACVGLCDALPLLRGRVHLRGGLACLCIPSAARRPCVFVCDVYVSPSADGCPPLYVMRLSMRVSATCVGHVWAAYACLTFASWRGAHVSMPVACHSGVRARHCGPCAPLRVCWSLSVPPPPLPPGSQCYWGASCYDNAPSSLLPPFL